MTHRARCSRVGKFSDAAAAAPRPFPVGPRVLAIAASSRTETGIGAAGFKRRGQSDHFTIRIDPHLAAEVRGNLRLRLNEFEQIGVDLVCIGRRHAVRETLVGFQLRALHQLGA
jgi:predicted pyridoxine 5'-phosphate oxidase superfamily flavin-nucleotide-binding protein